MRKFLAYLILLGDPEGIPLSDALRYWFKSLLLLFPFALIGEAVTGWIKYNAIFWALLFFILAINCAVGAYTHFFRLKTFSWKELVIKNSEIALIAFVAYVVLDVVRYIAGDNLGAELYSKVIQITTILFPGSKILKNVYILSYGKYPPKFVMERLYTFEKSGDVSKLFTHDSGKEINVESELEELKKEIDKFKN